MASIHGITLKNLKIFSGMEGRGFSASVYLEGKRLGTVRDEAYGGSYLFDMREDALRAIDERILEYQKKNPELDYLLISRMSAEEAWERCKRHLLPTKKPDRGNILFRELFFSKLVNLTLDERKYKSGAKRGLTHLLNIHFLHVKDTPLPSDLIFQYSDRKEKTEFLKEMRKKGCPVVTEKFAKPEDFEKK